MNFAVTQLVLAIVALLSWPLETFAATGLAGPRVELAAITELSYANGHEHAHADGTPCPDEGDEPCGPDCACTCCHGHSGAKVGVPLAPLVSNGDPPSLHPLGEAGELNPIELIKRVFHPPRA